MAETDERLTRLCARIASEHVHGQVSDLEWLYSAYCNRASNDQTDRLSLQALQRLEEKLTARALVLAGIVAACKAHMVRADNDNKAAGVGTSFARQRCSACEARKPDIRMLREAATVLAALRQRDEEIKS